MKPIFITDEGKALIAAAVGGEDPINFTRICTFDSVYPERHIAQSALISGIARNGSLCEVFGVLDNSELCKSYCILGLGLFADTEDGEILFGVCEEDRDAFCMPAKTDNSRTEVTLRIALTADCTDNVILSPNSDAYASAVQLREEIAGLDGRLSGKADSDHTHDDRYYTETEIDSKLNGKAAAAHTHNASEVSGLPASLPANGGNAATVNGHSVNSDVPANAKFTDTTYGNASSSAAGLVSTGAQTFAGNKSFNGQVLPNGASACGTAQARKLSSGTAEPNSTTCPAGAWYGQYE